jgi:hypothetical protein
MNLKKIEKHIGALEERHHSLDKQINTEMQSYGNDRLVTVLKKQKLKLKDEIEQFKKQLV